MSEEVNEKQENKRKIPFLSEGLMIATMTAVGYACAYYYDKGYKGHFLVPEEFIELSPTMIIRVISLTIITSVALLLIVDYVVGLVRMLRSINDVVAKKIDTILLLFFSYLFITFLFGITKYTMMMILIILIIATLYMFAWPVLKFRAVNGYLNKLEKSMKIGMNRNGAPIEGIVFLASKRFGRGKARIAFIILFVILAIPNLSVIGETLAKSQTNYLVIEGKPHFVMVGTYKDHAIVAELDLKKKEIIPNYKLIKNEKFNAKLYKLGQLKVAEPETLK